MPERRQAPLLVLGSIILFVLICLLVAIPLALDRLSDRLTAAISEEVHSEMWEQIRQNNAEQAADRRQVVGELKMKDETQDAYINTWRERVIKQHPELGDN